MNYSIAMNAAEEMQREIQDRYPGIDVRMGQPDILRLIAKKAVESREQRARVLGREFSRTWVIGMIHEVCMNIIEQACQKYPTTKRQDDFWAEFWPDTVKRISAKVM